MNDNEFIFKYETRDKAKTIRASGLRMSADGTFSVEIDKEDFKTIFSDPDEALIAYNRNATHG